MPSRRRPKSPTNSPADSRHTATSSSPAPPGAGGQTDIERFAAAMKASEKADLAEKARREQARTDAALRAEQTAAKAAALTAAHHELERAVEGVRTAKQVGRGRADADQVWKVAKALVIELETGTPPSWAPKLPDPLDADESSESVDAGGESADGASEEPADSQ